MLQRGNTIMASKLFEQNGTSTIQNNDGNGTSTIQNNDGEKLKKKGNNLLKINNIMFSETAPNNSGRTIVPPRGETIVSPQTSRFSSRSNNFNNGFNNSNSFNRYNNMNMNTHQSSSSSSLNSSDRNMNTHQSSSSSSLNSSDRNMNTHQSSSSSQGNWTRVSSSNGESNKRKRNKVLFATNLKPKCGYKNCLNKKKCPYEHKNERNRKNLPLPQFGIIQKDREIIEVCFLTYLNVIKNGQPRIYETPTKCTDKECSFYHFKTMNEIRDAKLVILKPSTFKNCRTLYMYTNSINRSSSEKLNKLNNILSDAMEFLIDGSDDMKRILNWVAVAINTISEKKVPNENKSFLQFIITHDEFRYNQWSQKIYTKFIKYEDAYNMLLFFKQISIQIESWKRQEDKGECEINFTQIFGEIENPQYMTSWLPNKSKILDSIFYDHLIRKLYNSTTFCNNILDELVCRRYNLPDIKITKQKERKFKHFNNTCNYGAHTLKFLVVQVGMNEQNKRQLQECDDKAVKIANIGDKIQQCIELLRTQFPDVFEPKWEMKDKWTTPKDLSPTHPNYLTQMVDFIKKSIHTDNLNLNQMEQEQQETIRYAEKLVEKYMSCMSYLISSFRRDPILLCGDVKPIIIPHMKFNFPGKQVNFVTETEIKTQREKLKEQQWETKMDNKVKREIKEKEARKTHDILKDVATLPAQFTRLYNELEHARQIDYKDKFESALSKYIETVKNNENNRFLKKVKQAETLNYNDLVNLFKLEINGKSASNTAKFNEYLSYKQWMAAIEISETIKVLLSQSPSSKDKFKILMRYYIHSFAKGFKFVSGEKPTIEEYKKNYDELVRTKKEKIEKWKRDNHDLLVKYLENEMVKRREFEKRVEYLTGKLVSFNKTVLDANEQIETLRKRIDDEFQLINDKYLPGMLEDEKVNQNWSMADLGLETSNDLFGMISGNNINQEKINKMVIDVEDIYNQNSKHPLIQKEIKKWKKDNNSSDITQDQIKKINDKVYYEYVKILIRAFIYNGAVKNGLYDDCRKIKELRETQVVTLAQIESMGRNIKEEEEKLTIATQSVTKAEIMCRKDDKSN